MAQYHVTLASDRTCDHMHDGLGFLTMHAGLTLMFEQSMQSVDARVSLPYWDFTIDKGKLDVGNWSTLDQSPVWDKDWFGTAEYAGDLHTVVEGRWAYISIESGVSGSTFHNSYGYLRSPWNNNARAYLTRSSDLCGQKYDSIPTCQIHYHTLSTTSTWTAFAWVLPYRPHGQVHMYVGGTLDCNATYTGIETYVKGVIQTSVGESEETTREVEHLVYMLRTEASVSLKNMCVARRLVACVFLPPGSSPNCGVARWTARRNRNWF